MEPFKLERHFAKYEFKAKWMASSSDAETMTVSELLSFEEGDSPQRVNAVLGALRLGYSESTGIPELREAISKTYLSVNSDQILAHCGGEEPIFNFFHACLNPGDHVVVHFPSYQSLYTVPRSIGCEVSLWQTTFENNWQLNIDELKTLLRPNTKAVIVNSPHNPTGFVMGKKQQEDLIQVLSEKNIMLFSDEIYRGLEMDESNRLPAACDLYESAVSLGGLAKSYGLAGLRIGWIATRNEKILKKMASQKDYTTICNPLITETLAVTAVRHREKIISRNVDLVRQNWGLVESFFKRHSQHFEVVPPKGGTMIFPRARASFDIQKFISSFLDQESVLVVAGDCFDMPACYFRLGLGRKNFPEVLAKLEQHLAKI